MTDRLMTKEARPEERGPDSPGSGENFPGRTKSGSSVNVLDPIADSRWQQFVDKHPRSTIFHTRAWLKALRDTYGYTPMVYTTASPEEELQNGIVFCDVNSWLTGRRLVSLPFSDHCEPLIDSVEDAEKLAAGLDIAAHSNVWKYIELRPLRYFDLPSNLFRFTGTYHFHELDLEPSLESIFQNFHKDSIQRKIRRAERECVEYREGNDQFAEFYRLMVVTRRRHKVPPQPKGWFLNLMKNFGEALKIRVAYHKGKPVAGMLTLRFKQTFVYKYGCADVRFNRLGGMHLLYWNAIQEAKASGHQVFDFGRCDSDQAGLIVFKRRWGAKESVLSYTRYAAVDNSSLHFPPPQDSFTMSLAKKVFAIAPRPCLSFLGKILYKHVG
jgi:hypothetical protein